MAKKTQEKVDDLNGRLKKMEVEKKSEKKAPKKKDKKPKESKFEGSDAFKQAIIAHLKDTARKDKLFLATLKKPNKNINDCCTFIFNHVKKTGLIGFAEDEIYQLARHYYDEDEIEVGAPITHGHVVINQQIALTEEQIAQAKQEARERVIKEEMARMRKKPEKKKKTTIPKSLQPKEEKKEESSDGQASLF